MSNQLQSFTRKEFHDLVWSNSSYELALTLGITQKQLVRTCRDYLIPFPPERYWEKIDAGGNPKRTPLREVENEALWTVVIGNKPASVSSAYATSVIKQSLLAAEGKAAPISRKPEPAPTPKIKPPKESVSPPARFTERIFRFHSIASSVRSGFKEPGTPRGDIRVGSIIAHPNSAERVIRLVHFMCVDLEAAGFDVKLDDKLFSVTSEQEEIKIEIEESYRRHKYTPTDAEIKALERARHRSRLNNFANWPSALPDYSYEHTGRLALTLYPWMGSERHKWGDGSRQLIETMWPEIANAISLRLDALKTRREEQEAQQRRRIELARRRALAEKRVAREQSRLALLQKLAETEREAADIRLFLQRADRSSDLVAYQRLLIWAKERLAHLEGLYHPTGIAKSIEHAQLFPDEDPYFDPEGEPPPKKGRWDD